LEALPLLLAVEAVVVEIPPLVVQAAVEKGAAVQVRLEIHHQLAHHREIAVAMVLLAVHQVTAVVAVAVQAVQVAIRQAEAHQLLLVVTVAEEQSHPSREQQFPMLAVAEAVLAL
jgi:hypothetical protein